MKKVLWLASWYPNQLEPLTGDFIERHAKAASLCNAVTVVHVLRDHLNVTKGRMFKEKRIYNDRCQASIIYYKVSSFGIPWISRLISAFLFLKHFINETKLYIAQNGRPDLVHVHVSQKAGLVALWLKWFYNLPYVVTEHWTGFCPGALPNFDQQSILFRLTWKLIMKRALGCSTVSDYLGLALKSKLKSLEYTVIPNVVDTEIFKEGASGKENIFRFIHVSTLTYQKNPVDIFQAIKILSSNTDRNFELIIYGPAKPELQRLINELGIQSKIVFKKESSQEVLANDLQRSDVLILYSLYETFGCVIIEANACGLPVIVSDIAVLHENVVEHVTGVFVPLHQPARLAEKMLWMMQNIQLFDAKQIVGITSKRYSFETVARQFDVFYEHALEKNASGKNKSHL